MVLEKKYVRDGQGRLLGSVTSGFAGDSTVVRDHEGRFLGTTCELFHWTKDETGTLVSKNTPDFGLIIPKKK